MSQQISMEDAFPTFQKKCSELFDANMLLQAQVDVLTKELEAVRAENEQLKASPADSSPGGAPDLAAQPPYPAGDEDPKASTQATRSAV